MRRRLQRFAGRAGATNAASRCGAPDRTTPVRAVARSGAEELPFESIRTNKKITIRNGAISAQQRAHDHYVLERRGLQPTFRSPVGARA